MFLATAAWTGVVLSCGTNRFAWNFLLHHPAFVIATGETVTGTTGYSLCTESRGVVLYYTDVDPVFSAQKSVDGKPILLTADCDISAIFHIPRRLMILVSAAATVTPAWWLWTSIRRRHQIARGFPVFQAQNAI